MQRCPECGTRTNPEFGFCDACRYQFPRVVFQPRAGSRAKYHLCAVGIGLAVAIVNYFALK